MSTLAFTKVSERTINVGPERHLITVEPITQNSAGPDRAQLAEAEAITQQLIDARVLLRAFIEDARSLDGLPTRNSYRTDLLGPLFESAVKLLGVMA